MDMIRFFCSKCGSRIKVPASAAGKNGRCPSCGALNLVPAHSNVDADLEARLHRAKHDLDTDDLGSVAEEEAISDTLQNVIDDADDPDTFDAEYATRVNDGPSKVVPVQEDVSGILGSDTTWEEDSDIYEEPESEAPADIESIEQIHDDNVDAEGNRLGIDYSEFDKVPVQSVSKDRRGTYLVVGAVAVLVIGLGWAFLTRGGTPPEMQYHYFYDVNTKEVFVRPWTEVPPVEAPSGGVGLRAFVYSCSSCDDAESRFVGYLERYPFDARGDEAQYRDRIQLGEYQKEDDAIHEKANEKRQLVMPGGTSYLRWESEEAQEIRASVTCPGGGEPKACAAQPPSE